MIAEYMMSERMNVMDEVRTSDVRMINVRTNECQRMDEVRISDVRMIDARTNEVRE